jgi:hypothetical protein
MALKPLSASKIGASGGCETAPHNIVEASTAVRPHGHENIEGALVLQVADDGQA